ncbi:hypothetical protein MY1884_007559 [Beauveria asiatica]|uniref:ABM domain-containing protein n=1 Tax=Beauveria asiatica TaxID=1069075 RepID=A0AAW0S3H9_9HYPO
MPVTEFALFTLRESYDAVELLELVMECQEIQDEWVRAHHPNECAKKASVSRLYADATEPGRHRVAITAPWQSPAAHLEWLDTPANKQIMAKFAAFLPGGIVPDHHTAADPTASEADRGFLFFHMDTAGRRPHLHEAFSPEETLVVTRLAAVEGAAGREQLQARYTELEGPHVAGRQKDRVWAGWRIEKEENREELVIFRSADLAADELAPLNQYGKPIGPELRIAEIAP